MVFLTSPLDVIWKQVIQRGIGIDQPGIGVNQAASTASHVLELLKSFKMLIRSKCIELIPLGKSIGILQVTAGTGNLTVSLYPPACACCTGLHRHQPPCPPTCQLFTLQSYPNQGVDALEFWFNPRLLNFDRHTDGPAEDRSALRGRAAALAEAHWNVVVLDSRGRGESGGAFCTFGAREIGDINLWLNQLRQLIGPKARFYIWGRSMGAAIALGAALADRSILGVILEAPYDTLQHSISTALRKRRIPGFLASWMISRASTLAGVRLDDPSPVERAAQLRTPALILAGENDSIAPLHQVHRLIKQLPNTPRLIVVPGASHQDVFEKGGPELASEIRTFLNEVRQAKSSRD